MNPEWIPTRKAGLAHLQSFLPAAGRDYARSHNFDFGPERRGNVSALSPWIRHRLLTEWEVVRAVLSLHGSEAAEKFIQAIFRRSYWKGWLEMRPQIWADYRAETRDALTALAWSGKRLETYQRTMECRSGIDCMDAWVQELRDTGYLHLHARMWFASIWIFTLKLPWSLGANFFMRHLLDGDTATNALSWRWVAGRQTIGKTYLARADNIRHFTAGRFSPEPEQLAETSQPPRQLPDHPPPEAIPASGRPDPDKRSGLLLTEEDLTLMDSPALPHPVAVAGTHYTTRRSPESVADPVLQFTAGAVRDGLARNAEFWACPGTLLPAVAETDTVLAWARQHRLTQILVSWAPIGPAREALDAMRPVLGNAGVDLIMLRCTWDSLYWPHATHSFFQFRQKIPAFIQGLTSSQDPA